MNEAPLLQDIVVLLVCSLPVVFVCQKIGLPALVGFLVTGIVIGPSAGGLIHDPENVQVLAELGVALLLFTIGLEFSLTRLASMRRMILGAGGLQVVGTFAIMALAARITGAAWQIAVVLGLVAALSSTAVVLKILSDRAEIHMPHGQFAVSILLFQDFSVLPMLMLLPLLAQPEHAGIGEVVRTLAIACAATTVVIVAARRILPAVFGQVLRLRSQELFIGVVVLTCFGTAWLASSLGISIAIGAFIAGLVISESEYSHQVVADILPLRDLFSSIFFVSVGMLLDLTYLAGHFGQVLALLVSLMVVKATVGTLAVMPFHASRSVAILVGAAIAQVGEFSFVLAAEAQNVGILVPGAFQGVLAASVFSMVLAPFLLRIAAAYVRGRETVGATPAAELESDVPGGHHVVIVGYGLTGRNLARVLSEAGIPFCIVDFDPEPIEQARAKGFKSVYGDAARTVVLEHVNAQKAGVIVVAIRDAAATRRIVAVARRMNQSAAICVRTRYIDEIEELYRLGATEVIPEELETSVEMFARVLECLNVPKNVIGAQIEVVRSEHYAVLRGAVSPKRHIDRIYDIFAAATTITYMLRDGSRWTGRTIGDLDIHRKTRATLIAIVRDGAAHTHPDGDFVLAVRDILVLIGNHAELAAARALLDPSRAEAQAGRGQVGDAV